MNADRERILEAAAQLEHPDYRPALEALIELKGGEWYIDEKFVQAPDEYQRRDNGRVLKYAYNFHLNGGDIEFLREENDAQTPDLAVLVEGTTFYVEVRKFRINVTTDHQAAKISGQIKGKASQLPVGSIGFVAIDNFSLKLESVGREMTYEHIFAALDECQRAGTENPVGWRQPSGAVISAHTSGGAWSGPISIPHFVWTNPHAEPRAPDWLARWVAGALPDGQLLDISSQTTSLHPESSKDQ